MTLLMQKVEPATIEVCLNVSKGSVDIRCMSGSAISVMSLPAGEARRVSVELEQCAAALAARIAARAETKP